MLSTKSSPNTQYLNSLTKNPQLPTHTTMSPTEWIAIPDNPRQRDTEKHLKKATHLLTPNQTHSHVAMAKCFQTTQQWKLDGHTRALLWATDPDLAPKEIHVTIYYVNSEDEAKELYTYFDNQRAVETGVDRISGAFHELNWNPQSAVLRKGNISIALLFAETIFRNFRNASSISDRRKGKTIDVYSLVQLWQDELKTFDSLLPHAQRFNANFITAALVTIRRYKADQRTMDFWSLYNQDRGVKLEDSIDGVEAATRLFARRSSHSETQSINIGKIISCFEMFRRKRNYKLGPKGLLLKSTDVATFFPPKESPKDV